MYMCVYVFVEHVEHILEIPVSYLELLCEIIVCNQIMLAHIHFKGGGV